LKWTENIKFSSFQVVLGNSFSPLPELGEGLGVRALYPNDESRIVRIKGFHGFFSPLSQTWERGWGLTGIGFLQMWLKFYFFVASEIKIFTLAFYPRTKQSCLRWVENLN
jgi:hypothetical protein